MQALGALYIAQMSKSYMHVWLEAFEGCCSTYGNS